MNDINNENTPVFCVMLDYRETESEEKNIFNYVIMHEKNGDGLDYSTNFGTHARAVGMSFYASKEAAENGYKRFSNRCLEFAEWFNKDRDYMESSGFDTRQPDLYKSFLERNPIFDIPHRHFVEESTIGKMKKVFEHFNENCLIKA